MRLLSFLLLALAYTLPVSAQSYPNPTFAPATGATAARTYADRAADVLNVRDFGARCNGATDDYAAFAAAMARAATRAGSTVLIPASPTSCLLSQSFIIPSRTTLWAAPGSVTLAPMPGNAAGILLVQVASLATDVTVYGVTIDGGGEDCAVAFAVTTSLGRTLNYPVMIMSGVSLAPTSSVVVGFGVNFDAWFASLPTTPPASGPWNNGGDLSVGGPAPS